ncbi:MAG: class I SAM-dependent methyltransferase [Candidatus Omnitrophica bacterium]|nr:class I SAM-dependent methyltransferase [Candidatus Omnitrophota bacterium]
MLIETPASSLGRWIRRKAGQSLWHRNPDYWDKELAGSSASYLDGLDVDIRNAIIRILIHRFAPHAHSLLDLGCASGGLASCLLQKEIEVYVGVDISKYAIEKATAKYNSLQGNGIYRVNFFTSDLCEFIPKNNALFDLIAFNEVLYYLTIEEAIGQVERYTKYLSPIGMVFICMKDDPKSHTIYRHLSKKLGWVYGILFQEQAVKARHRIVISSEHPALLVGLFKP